ncbi:HEAT repeat-containing protein [Wolffia australiana]
MAKRGGIAVDAPLSRFGVLVAQLESVAASARQQPPDSLLCFDLLSELVSAIDDDSKEAIVPWQRKCEEALYSLLIKGPRRPVRRLASLAMAKVIEKGDSISVYSRVSSLQGWLADSRRSEPTACAGVAQCLGELYHVFGRRISSGLTETSSIVSKLMRFHEDFVRQDAILMLQKALDGSGGTGSSLAFSEAFRILTRAAGGDKAYNVRLAAAKCLKTFADIQAPGLRVPELENAALYCIKALDDPVTSVRDAFAEALGAFLALGMNLENQDKQKGRSSPPRKLEGCVERHLMAPFVKASGARSRDIRIGLTLSWVFFLQAIHLKYRLPDSDLQEFALKALSMLQSKSSKNAHELACVLYILRVGVSDQMIEPTQRDFVGLLCQQLKLSDFSPSMGVGVLRTLSYLLSTLGQVPLDFKQVLDDTVVAALSHSSIHVRVEAAMTLRTLAEVDPTCVGGLISYGVTTLNALRESISFEKGNHLKFDLDSLHGQAALLAALVSISPKLPLGYPARLPTSVFEVSKKMLTESNRNPVSGTVEKEAGWLLLASLLASMPRKDLEDQVFDILLLWAGPFVTNIDDYISEKQDLITETSVLSAALEALSVFVKNFVSPKIASNRSVVSLQPVLVYLRGALSYMRNLRSRPVQGIKASVNMFTLRVLMAYQSLDPLAYKEDHPQIIEICTVPFSNPSECEESSCLRWLLDKRDASLGPWIPGRDFLEDELRAFQGGEDGMLPCLWEDRNSNFPQPEGLEKILVNQMLLCLGSIFACQDMAGKLRLLSLIEQCLKAGRKYSWHGANLTNTCVVLLFGIKAMYASHTQVLENQVLTSIQHIFQIILADGEITAAQRRASAEGLGLLARIGNDLFAARMARSLLSDLTVATDASYVASLALSLGCINRSAGGMALSSLVPGIGSSILSLVRTSNVGTQLWSLHSLVLVIEAAGLSYVSNVQATLSLAIDTLLAEENGLVDLRQGIGRLINALVAVIGPELSPGSTFFSRCKSVVAETCSGGETSTLLESVRFTQQLVLFAPQAVSMRFHLKTLLPTLFSRQPTLRHLAVSTLRHLIEKDAVAIIEECIEGNLFRMLDEETDSEIGSLVRTTISRLLNKSCPSCPSRWLAICRSMALAMANGNGDHTHHAKLEVNISKGKLGVEEDHGLYQGTDDENMISSSGATQNQDSGFFGSVYLKQHKHLRYRTRVFAAECLSSIPLAVGADCAHFEPSLARKRASTGSNDWLVLHLQELISLAYQISTSQFESMQHIGVEILLTIMEKFEDISDPDLPGHLLLEQYQVQFVSAVRAAIQISSDPSLLEAGILLATKILTSSMLASDQVSIQRMFSLISRPLDDFDDLYYPSFAEWVACKIKIRILAAHASVKCYVYFLLRDGKSIPHEYLTLIPLFSDISPKLVKRWIGLLKDCSYIFLGLGPKFSTKSILAGIPSPVSSKIKSCLDKSWPIILQAIALDSAPVKSELENSTENVLGSSTQQKSLSGKIMVSLEVNEFDLLWGLVHLLLFQRHRPVPDSGENSLFSHSESLLETSMVTLQFLSAETFFVPNFVTVELSKELLQVLLLLDSSSKSWNSLSVPFLSKILQYCPISYFADEDFTSAATELCIKYIQRFCSSADLASQDLAILENSIYGVFCVAESLLSRNSSENLWKLKLRVLSMSYKCVSRTSNDLYLSKLLSFLRCIPSFFKGSPPNADTFKLLQLWAEMGSELGEDCKRKLHNLDTQLGDSWKLLGKKLSFFVEDAIAVAKLAHETWGRGKEEIHKPILFSIFNQSIKCVRMTLNDDNLKVRAVGLLTLKNAAQKAVIEGLNVDVCDFLLLFAGELLEELLLLVEGIPKNGMKKESIVISEECLRYLVLLHTLAQGKECSELLMTLILEAIIMILSSSSEIRFQEASEIKVTATRLLSHLVQSPSSSAQIKNVLLAMPQARRQQLQDIIRSSISPTDNTSLPSKQTSQPLTIKLPAQPAVFPKEESPSDFKDDNVNADDDNDDDWDTFQSLPAADGVDQVPISLTSPPGVERESRSFDAVEAEQSSQKAQVLHMDDNDDGNDDDDDENWDSFQSPGRADDGVNVVDPIPSPSFLEREDESSDVSNDDNHSRRIDKDGDQEHAGKTNDPLSP